MVAPPVHTENVACLNCGEPLHGKYCSACGQEDAPALPSLKELVGEVAEEFAKLESRVPQTLISLLLRPGELTQAYARGQRMRYISPMKLYFMSSFVFYLLMDVFNGKDMGSLGAKFPNESAPAARSVTNAAKFFMENSATFAIVLLPLSAIALIVLFRGRKLPFILHLVTTLHAWSGSVAYFSLLYFALKVSERWVHGPDAMTLFGGINAILMVGYQIPCFRRVYGASWPEAIFKSVLMSLWTFAVSMIGLIFAIIAFVILNR